MLHLNNESTGAPHALHLILPTVMYHAAQQQADDDSGHKRRDNCEPCLEVDFH
jgi:hypothetical protein